MAWLVCAICLTVASALDVSSATSNANGAAGPCDIYANAGSPCVAAHSTVRTLYASRRGPLYQVKRSDGKTLDIMATNTSYADSAAQDRFCTGKKCVIQTIYDQSPNGNHLVPPPACHPVDAQAHKVVINGHPVYGVYNEDGAKNGYHASKTKGIATGNDPETIYMVTSGKRFNSNCCYDYGNVETGTTGGSAGSMESVYFGTAAWRHNSALCPGKSCPVSGAGHGPWVGADLEQGMYYGSEQHTETNTPLTYEFVTAMLKGKTDGFALKGGDATNGKLKTMYDGPHPKRDKGTYSPMKKQGGIGLGIGGDTSKGHSNSALGIFYEGLMTHGVSTDAADDAVQANIVAAGYGRGMVIQV